MPINGITSAITAVTPSGGGGGPGAFVGAIMSDQVISFSHPAAAQQYPNFGTDWDTDDFVDPTGGGGSSVYGANGVACFKIPTGMAGWYWVWGGVDIATGAANVFLHGQIKMGISNNSGGYAQRQDFERGFLAVNDSLGVAGESPLTMSVSTLVPFEVGDLVGFRWYHRSSSDKDQIYAYVGIQLAGTGDIPA